MGVEKYRSGEEMNAAPVAARGGEGFESFLRACARYRRLAPFAFPAGVFKFRSIEEAQEARERVDQDVSRCSRGGFEPAGRAR
jgi:hypothetical protein